MVRLLTCAMLLCACFASIALAQTDLPVSDSPVAPAADAPAPLQPKQPRSEQTADRIAAAAHFTQGRLLQRRDDKAAALRAYQRAWRYDPRGSTILAEIIPLAFELQRSDEAARYAVLAAQASPTDPILVRRLALHLSEQRQWEQAAGLYERSLELQPDLQTIDDLGSAMLHYELGRLFFLSDQFDKSAGAFAKVRDAVERPDSPLDKQSQQVLLGQEPRETYLLWAESFLAAKQYDAAAALFKKANADGKKAAELALQLARVEAGRENTAQAIEQLNRFFAEPVQDPTLEPYLLLAQAFERQTTDKRAASAALLKRLAELRGQRPDDAALAYFYAEQLAQAGQAEVAEKLLVETLAKQPASNGYRQLTKIYRAQAKLQPLLKTLSEVVEKTGSLQIIEDEATALRKTDALLDQLLETTREQQKSSPPELATRQLFAVGLLALDAERWDEAKEMFEAQIAADKASTGEVLLSWGLGLYLADQNEQAIAIFQRMIADKALPQNEAAVYYSLAGALEMAGRTDEALAAIRKASELDPDNTDYAPRVGWILYHAKRYDDAQKAYRDFLQAHDARHDSAALRETLKDTRLALSSIALAQNDFAAAVEWLEQVLDEYPADAGALNDLGYLWAERGLHPERAVAMTRQAVAAEPDNRAYRDSLGWAYYQTGRFDEALHELLLATAEVEPDGVVLDHLGDIHHKLGKRAEALAAWQRARDAFQKAGEMEKSNVVQAKIAANGEL